MKKTFALVLCAIMAVGQGMQAQPDKQREREFANPPREYRPRVWWHWMNGNITKDGIRKDLQWMDRAGIVGFHCFDAGLSTPQVVEKRLAYMTPEWKDAFNYAMSLADSLRMEVTIASSPGWSITGGPWVSDEDAEKKLIWTDIVVEGGQRLKRALPMPPETTGPFFDIPKTPKSRQEYLFYRDLYVMAVKLPDNDVPMMNFLPTVVSSDASYPAKAMMDHLYATAYPVSCAPGEHAYMQLEFPEPHQMKSALVAEQSGVLMTLECSDDGQHYRSLIDTIPASNAAVRVMDFEGATARCFRIRALEADTPLQLAEFSVCPVTRVNMALDKSGFYSSYNVSDHYPTPATTDAVPLSDVIDITSHYKDGVLKWNVPAGRWRIFRFGYNLLGRENGPASPEATGLEVDKLDEGAIRRYYKNYLGMYERASNGRLGVNGVIKNLMIDSYESGRATWTIDMERKFQLRRHYALRPWLPCLAGMVLGSAEESERFLFDWRQTLGELMAECHYDLVNDILEPYGMKRHTESHEERTAFVGDGMMVKRKAHFPMSAFWVRFNAGWHSLYPTAEADVKESSSVAHIYGQNICAAESFTVNGSIGKWDGFGAYQCHPGLLKPVADAAMAQGLNRFVIHCSAHQPVDDRKPGLGLGHYGQWFNRHDTWAEEARTWTDYLSRSCYLLQQGRYVADVAYFYGEDKNVTGRFMHERVPMPRGWNFDFVNADILCNVVTVDKGTLKTPSGMQYRLLVIDNQVKYMSLPLLERLAYLVRQGVAVCGPRPIGMANLQGDENRFKALVAEIWDGRNARVFERDGIDVALRGLGVEKDLDVLPTMPLDDMRFVHRHVDDGEIYWLANLTPAYRDVDVSFRVTGKKPMVWHADTQVREEASYVCEDGRTTVRLHLTPDDAQFILFTEETTESRHDLAEKPIRALGTLDVPWHVSLASDKPIPGFDMTRLQSLSQSASADVRHFAGTATYTTTFAGVPYDGVVYLDLGEVHNMARVTLNGHDLGLLWKTPYKVRIDQYLQAQNTLEVKVINSWANRLIGDAALPVEQRSTYTPITYYRAGDPLLPSGLVGPVRLLGQ